MEKRNLNTQTLCLY